MDLEHMLVAPKVTVYGRPGCNECEKTKRYLTKHDVGFTYVDLTKQPGMVDVLKDEWGFKELPVVDIGVDRFSGHEVTRLKSIVDFTRDSEEIPVFMTPTEVGMVFKVPADRLGDFLEPVEVVGYIKDSKAQTVNLYAQEDLVERYQEVGHEF